MHFTDLFIRRPVLAMVVSALITLLGLYAFKAIDIRQYPKLEKSSITIVTAYPGASAEAVQGFITTPIQQAVASVEGLDYVSASTGPGLSTVNVHVQLGFDGNVTMMQVFSSLAAIKGRLPAAAENSVVSKQTESDSAILYLSFFSDSMTAEQITEYVSREVQPRMQSLEGVAEASTMGGKSYAMRVWLSREKLAAHGLDLAEVLRAIRANNHQAAVGKSEGAFVQMDITADTDLSDVAGFEELVIGRRGARLVRLGEVARIELGAESRESEVIYQGRNAVLVAIKPVSRANPLTVAAEVKAHLPEIQRQMPGNLQVASVYDVSDYINASIDEVVTTLLEAIAIVVLVVFVFLGSWRSVLIPVVTIPLSMIGVIFLMQAMGFSINLLTLLALVLAVGLVVDDAIVVVENVSRHIAEGKSPLAAARIGAREIALPVVAMTLTLAAVYAPIGFMGGLTGVLFKEFAFTLAAAVIVSGVVALTLSPVMCAALLRSGGGGALERVSEAIFGRLQQAYRTLLVHSLRFRSSTVLVMVAVLLTIPHLWRTSQSELAPTEDQGVLLVSGSAPKSAGFEFTRLYSGQIGRILEGIPETSGYFLISGSPSPNALFGIQILKPWDQRERTQMQVQPLLQGALSGIAGLQTVSFPMPSLPGGASGMPVQFVLYGNLPMERIHEVGEAVKQKAMASGLFAYADLDLKFDRPVAEVRVDRTMANALGVNMETIGQALSAAFSGAYVDRFNLDERSYKVIPQLEPRARLAPSQLEEIQVKSATGKLVSLGAVVDIDYGVAPDSLAQFQQLNAATLSGVLLPGVSMGRAIAFLEQQAAETLPKGLSYDWTGESREFIQEGDTLLYAFVFALVMIFLVLAAQFDSLRDPFIILLTVPMAVAGALVPINLGFGSINIYTQIGLVTLIGLISKQGILMVEFANSLRRTEGLGIDEAIIRSSVIRLRPILMTASAIVIAVIPLVLAEGAGAVGRKDLGLVVFFGMAIGTLLCLFTVPVVFSYLASRSVTAEAGQESDAPGPAVLSGAGHA